MSIQFRTPRILQEYSSGKTELDVDGKTVGEVLGFIKRQYPSLYKCICDETGKLRQHLHLFVNEEMLVGPEAFHIQVESGDVVSVFQAVSGG